MLILTVSKIETPARHLDGGAAGVVSTDQQQDKRYVLPR